VNTDQERAKAERGRRMKELCEGKDGLFEVIDAVGRHYQASMLATDIADTAGREAIYHRQRALADIREVFRVGIVDGYAAERMISELAKRDERKQPRKARA
jgi:hypothetical protein